MRLLLFSLLLAAGCTATAQRRPTARELGELQDSVWRRLDAMRTTGPGFAACTPEREAFDGNANAAAHQRPAKPQASPTPSGRPGPTKPKESSASV